MFHHALVLIFGLFVTFGLGVFGGVAIERYIFSDSLVTEIHDEPQVSESPVEEPTPEVIKDPTIDINTNHLSVHYPIRLHITWSPLDAFTPQEIEKYITLDPPVEGQWRWKKHVLWGGRTAEFFALAPVPEVLKLTIDAPFLEKPLIRTFKKEHTVDDKNAETLLTCTPPRIVATVPEEGATGIDPTQPVKIVWNTPVEWEKMFPLLTVTPDLPAELRREMRLEPDESDDTGKTFLLSFLPHFPANEVVNIVVKNGVPDSNTAYPSTTDFTFSFTTGDVSP